MRFLAKFSAAERHPSNPIRKASGAFCLLAMIAVAGCEAHPNAEVDLARREAALHATTVEMRARNLRERSASAAGIVLMRMQINCDTAKALRVMKVWAKTSLDSQRDLVSAMNAFWKAHPSTVRSSAQLKVFGEGVVESIQIVSLIDEQLIRLEASNRELVPEWENARKAAGDTYTNGYPPDCFSDYGRP